MKILAGFDSIKLLDMIVGLTSQKSHPSKRKQKKIKVKKTIRKSFWNE